MKLARKVRSYEGTVEARMLALRDNPRIKVEHIGDVAGGVVAHSCFRVVVSSLDAKQQHSVFLSAGVHGNEPAGVWALLRFLETEVHKYTDMFRFVVYPCINPTGYERNIRTNATGLNLNSDFTLFPKSLENQIVLRSLHESEERFLFAMDLHETDMSEVTEDMPALGLTEADNPRGFYLYEFARDDEMRIGRSIVKTIRREGIRISTQPEIFKDKNFGGVISYPIERGRTGSPLFADGVTFDNYLFDYHTNHSFTIETISQWEAWMRVRAHIVAIETALDRYKRRLLA